MASMPAYRGSVEALRILGVFLEEEIKPELAYIEDDELMDGPTMLEQLEALKAARVSHG